MSTNVKSQEFQQLEQVGKCLAERLNLARKIQGELVCPVCHHSFDGTHLLKCPGCRTLISKNFQTEQPSDTSISHHKPPLRQKTFVRTRHARSRSSTQRRSSRQKISSKGQTLKKRKQMQLDFFS